MNHHPGDYPELTVFNEYARSWSINTSITAIATKLAMPLSGFAAGRGFSRRT
jgi:hypothetical protein